MHTEIKSVACILHQIVNSKSAKQVNHPIAPMARLLFATVRSCPCRHLLSAAATAAVAGAFVCCNHVASILFTTVLSSHLLQQLLLVCCICVSPLLPCVCRSHCCHCHLSAIHSSAAAVVTVLPPLATTTLTIASCLPLLSLTICHTVSHPPLCSIHDAPHHITLLQLHLCPLCFGCLQNTVDCSSLLKSLPPFLPPLVAVTGKPVFT
jgi:hypothetical protein